MAMSRWELVAYAGRKLGALGGVALVITILWNGYQGHEDTATASCPPAVAYDGKVPALDAPFISSVNTVKGSGDEVEWGLRKQLCVTILNVLSVSDEAKYKADLTSPNDSIAKAAKTALQGKVYQLYLNGLPTGLVAEARPTSAAQVLGFVAKPDTDAATPTSTLWRTILAQPTKSGRIAVELGLAPMEANPKGAASQTTLTSIPTVTTVLAKANDARTSLWFRVYEPWVMVTAFASMILITWGLCGLSYNTTLLRDGNTNLSAYSLSKCQMAFWLVLSTAGFLYIWTVTGQYAHVFPTALFTLVGISGAAAGAAQFMNASQAAGDPAAVPQSNNFLYDIAGAWKEGQPQIHRMQIIAWTVILGAIFCWNVIDSLKLTDFDTNLLILTGISNGVYITLKPQEPGKKG